MWRWTTSIEYRYQVPTCFSSCDIWNIDVDSKRTEALGHLVNWIGLLDGRMHPLHVAQNNATWFAIARTLTRFISFPVAGCDPPMAFLFVSSSVDCPAYLEMQGFVSLRINTESCSNGSAHRDAEPITL
jgi:hypothetical protein